MSASVPNPSALPRASSHHSLSHVDSEPRVTIEMGGPNIVIRSSDAVDRGYTTSLAHVVNAAADTRTVVVLDPDPIRCDDSVAGAPFHPSDIVCVEHESCRPVEVEVAGSGIIRIAAEHGWWLVDIAHGRFCRTERPADACFVDPAAWTPVVAVCVTPTLLRALTVDGLLISGARAHHIEHPALAG